MTKCRRNTVLKILAVAFFGGFGKLGAGSILSNTFDIQYPHYKIKIFILWAKIDAWDNEAAQIIVDGALAQEKKFTSTNGYYGKVCGNSQFPSKTLFSRTELEVNHYANSVQIQLTTNLNEAFDEESFGVRDFYLYYQECPSFCNQCTGPNGADCLSNSFDYCIGCKDGYSRTGIDQLMCQECYISCETCQKPTNEDCTGCGNYDLNNKELINGQCLCPKYMAEQIKYDGSTQCLPCHPRCEKCQSPQDNTNNQYCTKCIPGQHRIVSDEFRCICKTGYTDEGVLDICIKCHYTCENCSGPLSTNCTTCSLSSYRHLTADYQCLCDSTSIDKGLYDIICSPICHHSCADCANFGEDQCTLCPISRQPDRVGSSFKYVCIDSHYFSDNINLECQKCHPNSLTFSGSQENICLSCDPTYRQLIMSRCVCPQEYYDLGQLQCAKCHYTCNNCYGPNKDNCITCLLANNRKLKGNYCGCIGQSMEKQQNDPMCYKCSYQCAECSGTVDNCLSCPEYSYRELGVDNSCSCPVGSYDQINNPKCIICHYTCMTCNGSSLNQCTSCNPSSRRNLGNLNQCVCASKYYDVLLLQVQEYQIIHNVYVHLDIFMIDQM